MESGWHIQAGRGSGDELDPYVPTEIRVELPAGWVAGEPLWPLAHEFQFGEGTFAETLRGYEGRFVVAVPVEVPADAGRAERPVRVDVDYQACDDSICRLPESLVLEGTTAATVIDDAVAELSKATLSRAPTTSVAPPRSFDLSASKWWGSPMFVWTACLWMVYRTLRIGRRPGPLVATGLVAILLMWAMLAFTRAITAPPRVDWIAYDHAAFATHRASGETVLIKFIAV